MNINKLNIKTPLTLLITGIALITLLLCILQPKMHKQFEISIIKHIIKIDSNGDTTVTREITTTKIKDK